MVLLVRSRRHAGNHKDGAMKLRLVNAGTAAAHYVLAYAVAIPIFRLVMLARRLLRRGQCGPDEERTAS